MLFLTIFAFLAGVVTILSPCILPILPIVLSGSLSGGKWRPLGVVIGFVLSFTFFAVFAYSLSQALGFSTETLRYLSVVLLLLFGGALFSAWLQSQLEVLASRLMPSGTAKREGLRGGILLGLSLGFIWTPCVGPILASVLTLAATRSISFELVAIAGAYAFGSAVPMLAISYGGKRILETLPALRRRSALIQKLFGVLIIVTALMIYFNLDRTFQTYILHTFPNYGKNLTRFEEQSVIRTRLDKLKNIKVPFEESLQGDTYEAPNKSFSGGTNWIGTSPLSLEKELKGKVVLVDFWTYTCINCIRTLPHLTSWYQKYKDDGFVIVGVHSPEFEFERTTDNVKEAMARYGITYPVVQDNEFKIWRSYNNQYWPAHYLIDRQGRVRETHFGEGAYEETELKIRELLAEGGKEVTEPADDVPDTTPQSRLTPETYMGYGRMERFSSGESVARDVKRVYTVGPLEEDTFGLSGTWIVREEHAQSSMGSKLIFQIHAQDVFLVMAPAQKGVPGSVEVYLDGKKVTTGGDVHDGTITVDTDRLYHLVSKPVAGIYRLELRYLGPAVRVFAFTFG